MSKDMNRMYKKLLCGFILMCVFACVSAFASDVRTTGTPLGSDIVIYTYKVEPLVTLKTDKPGFLSEIAHQIIKHPTLSIAVKVNPMPILMKYGLIQSVGVAAIGLDADFSEKELQDLLEIPLYEYQGKTYKLFFNTRNPQGEPLYETALGYFDEIKANGTFDELKAKYGLD